MYQIIVGAPGSGKSYMAVNYLHKLCKYDPLYDEFSLPPNVLVISNIEGLRVNHWKYPDCMKGKTVEEFWTIENMESIQKKTGKYHLVIMIDEAHKFFPRSFKSDSVYNCFAEHRHIGMDCFMLTQGIQAFSPIFLPLVEFIVYAQPRSKKAGRGFLYYYKTKEGQMLYPKLLPLNKQVFRVYKSMRVDESNKPKSAVYFWAAATFALFIAAGSLFYYAVSGIKSKGSVSASTSSSVPSRTVASGSADLINPYKQAAVSSSSVVVSSVPSGFEWRSLPIEGWVEGNSGLWLLIGGKRVRYDERFRNLQRDWLTVEMLSEVEPTEGALGDRGKAEREPAANAAGA